MDAEISLVEVISPPQTKCLREGRLLLLLVVVVGGVIVDVVIGGGLFCSADVMPVFCA